MVSYCSFNQYRNISARRYWYEYLWDVDSQDGAGFSTALKSIQLGVLLFAKTLEMDNESKVLV